MLCSLLFIVLFAGCQKEVLHTSEVYRSKDLKIEFKDYTDSRCPINTDCIWAGEASVYLQAKSNGQTASFVLNGLGSDTTLFGYQIELVDLLPYPEHGKEINFNDKKVVLNVTKL